MSRSLEIVHFFSDEITIEPHTATSASDIGRPVSIREFAAGKPVCLWRDIDNGEYEVRRGKFPCVQFIAGPEVSL